MITPASRPKQSKAETFEMIKNVDAPVIILGIRGYYRKFGKDPLRNDIDIYDDALFVWSQNGYMTFNANTDPSILKPHVARLKPGIWQYKLGIHNLSKAKSRQYPALVQAAPVTVSRHKGNDDSGWFGLNIHRGSNTTTSSLGCQTIPPAQWSSFYELVKMEMNRAGAKTIPYVLVDKS